MGSRRSYRTTLRNLALWRGQSARLRFLPKAMRTGVAQRRYSSRERRPSLCGNANNGQLPLITMIDMRVISQISSYSDSLIVESIAIMS